jgi:Swt1-like HEPN
MDDKDLLNKHHLMAADIQRSIAETSKVRKVMMESIQRDTAWMKEFHQDSATQRMFESIQRDHELMRRALGPLEDLRRAGMFEVDSPWRREMERTRQLMADFEARFRLPEMPELARLTAELRSSPWAEALTRYSAQSSTLQQAMERMHRPWLEIQEQMRSMASFAELQGIGFAVRNMPSFGENLSAALRLDLGDWREPITWQSEILADLGARSDFYAGLGFNRALTEFPAPAFQESLDIAGLLRERPPIVDLYGAPILPSGDKDEEEGFERTNTAHDWLLRLETQLRAFIDEAMTQAFGPNWPKHRLPNGVYDQWQEKKQAAEKAGAQVRPLIAYADFTDYERVICRGDNWRELFGAFFQRPETVRESFQRLYPIRLDTMHARPITQDDELLLYVETRRLVKVIVRNG